MDTLSHALWSKGVFGYRGGGKLAVFFGVFPDISFGALFSIKIISGTLDYSGGPTLENLKQLEPIPSWLSCYVIINRKRIAMHIGIITGGEIHRAAVLIYRDPLMLKVLWQAAVA